VTKVPTWRAGRSKTSYAISVALGLVAAAAAGLSVFLPSVLAGADVTKGNLRGTAAVLLVVGLPVLTIGLLRSACGSACAQVIWLGVLGYLLYQAVLFCFGTPLNNLFMLSSPTWVWRCGALSSYFGSLT
jgi:hypothetical protein